MTCQFCGNTITIDIEVTPGNTLILCYEHAGKIEEEINDFFQYKALNSNK
jgi:hypothetical protein